jgi:hypothetical protein
MLGAVNIDILHIVFACNLLYIELPPIAPLLLYSEGVPHAVDLVRLVT